MTAIAYHISQEQFKPSELMQYALLAEKAGFNALHSSDHFHPWSERQGQSGFTFSWMGAALQATSLPCGMVCSPGQRYHPAIVAQAVATLAEMFPGRFWIALGSGEALNENITGTKWPSKKDRNLRLKECVEVMRKLLKGETVNHNGMVTVENARLYTLPDKLPLLMGAAISEETARWMGSFADGLVTVARPYTELEKVVNAFRNNGGKEKPVYLKLSLSYARTQEEAENGAFDQWRTNILEGTVLGEMSTVEQFDAAAEFIRHSDLKDKIQVSSDPMYHLKRIKEYAELGFEKIILHNVNRQQEVFISDFGREVLPALHTDPYLHTR